MFKILISAEYLLMEIVTNKYICNSLNYSYENIHTV